MQPGASRQRQRIVADVPMAAARRSTGGAVPRKDEPTAITSSKRHPVGSILLSWSHPHQSTVPANPCAPREAGTILPKDPAASYRERPRWWRRHVVAHSSRSPGGVRRDRTRMFQGATSHPKVKVGRSRMGTNIPGLCGPFSLNWIIASAKASDRLECLSTTSRSNVGAGIEHQVSGDSGCAFAADNSRRVSDSPIASVRPGPASGLWTGSACCQRRESAAGARFVE
jgi:hypothetical protein